MERKELIPIKKSKCLKIAKMGLVLALAMLVFVLPTSALYAEGYANSTLYTSPIKFEFSTFTGSGESYVTELTPSVMYKADGLPSTELVQSSYYYDPDINTDNFIGQWTFHEPLDDIKNILLSDGSTDKTYNFQFSYKINNTGEVKSCFGMRVREIVGEDGLLYYVIYYLRDSAGTDQFVAYRSKYGEFAQNSYQTINVIQTPPTEIKELLGVNGIRVDGNFGETVTYTNFTVNTARENGILSVNYDLSAPALSGVTELNIRVTANSGYYNGSVPLNPYIQLPSNVSAVVNRSYRQYTTDGRYTDKKTTSLNVNAGGVIPLFAGMPVGDFFIINYEMTIKLLVVPDEPDSGEWGDAGYYQFQDQLPYDEMLVEKLSTYSTSGAFDEYATIGLPSGTLVNGNEITGISFDRDMTALFYDEWASGDTILVYDFELDEWYAYENGSGNGWTVETVKTIYIPENLTSLTARESDYLQYFLSWLERCTSYSATPTLEGGTAGINKGKLLTVNYYVWSEDFNDEISEEFMHEYYTAVFNTGYDSNINGSGNEVDYTSWLAGTVGGFLDFELFPGFSLGGILGILISFAVVVLFLKFFAGG